jgi:hypothetical protein
MPWFSAETVISFPRCFYSTFVIMYPNEQSCMPNDSVNIGKHIKTYLLNTYVFHVNPGNKGSPTTFFFLTLRLGQTGRHGRAVLWLLYTCLIVRKSYLFEVLMAVIWRVLSSGMWRRIVGVVHRRFGGTSCFHLQDRRVSHESRVDRYLVSNVVHRRSDEQLYFHITVLEVPDSNPGLQVTNAEPFYLCCCLVANLFSM